MGKSSSLADRMLLRVTCLAALAVLAPGALAQPASNAGTEVPARTLPVPDTVSPQVQKLIAAPLRPGWNVLPKTGEDARTPNRPARVSPPDFSGLRAFASPR
jgi:epsilon-lactone hydrolase